MNYGQVWLSLPCNGLAHGREEGVCWGEVGWTGGVGLIASDSEAVTLRCLLLLWTDGCMTIFMRQRAAAAAQLESGCGSEVLATVATRTLALTDVNKTCLVLALIQQGSASYKGLPPVPEIRCRSLLVTK